ncbi:MAG: HD domain-containing protein, partial [Armatimonadota bacterium]|nr:HD domain-containing protein [Armatimonadota bacterium]
SETGAAGGLIMLVKSDTGEIVTSTERWLDPTIQQKVCDFSIEKWVAKSGHPAFIPGIQDDNTFEGKIQDKVAICVPLTESTPSSMLATLEKSNFKVIGTLSIYGYPDAPPFMREDLDLLRMLATHASMGIVNAGLYKELHERFLKTLQSLARSLEARDPYTQGHSYRVSEISVLVAKQLGLSEQSTEALRNAALLHDIGKIGVPDNVLRKPGKLTPEERLIIQNHPITGENICRPLDIGEEVLFLIRHHQERLNGTGYPDQLPAYQQPLSLRILCAVDALDAMSSDRPYRKALSAAERVDQLNKAAGIEFDRQVVEVLKSLLSSGELDRFYTEVKDDEILKAA